ncbi:hypothetical protein MXMO3_01703 [Maritalea myrionectae]|uniref:Uncharacterized protein n=1 Tax=Maritalea myrionectae TaxID=454601 RepID=A0A2R4MED9_9HYPH|nr:hypothetical protein [Maritalea myrionectae]AVX04229.1 hypothetical protein MXMO3_01703 [Maritalea myrionectae]
MGGIFGGGGQRKVEPKRMPDRNDPRHIAIERRKRQEISNRSGRSSTILSRPMQGAPGTQSYSNTLLGEAK